MGGNEKIIALNLLNRVTHTQSDARQRPQLKRMGFLRESKVQMGHLKDHWLVVTNHTLCTSHLHTWEIPVAWFHWPMNEIRFEIIHIHIHITYTSHITRSINKICQGICHWPSSSHHMNSTELRVQWRLTKQHIKPTFVKSLQLNVTIENHTWLWTKVRLVAADKTLISIRT